MKTLIPATVFLTLYFGFIIGVSVSILYLPDQVATHFDLSGMPDDWMVRDNYLMFMLLFGSGCILIMVILSLLCRIMPDSLINIQHREYWLSPERRIETKRYVMRHMLWFCSLWTCFFIGVHFSTVHANRLVPVQLPQAEFFGVVGGFSAGVFVWILILWLHFRRIE